MAVAYRWYTDMLSSNTSSNVFTVDRASWDVTPRYAALSKHWVLANGCQEAAVPEMQAWPLYYDYETDIAVRQCPHGAFHPEVAHMHWRIAVTQGREGWRALHEAAMAKHHRTPCCCSHLCRSLSPELDVLED